MPDRHSEERAKDKSESGSGHSHKAAASCGKKHWGPSRVARSSLAWGSESYLGVEVFAGEETKGKDQRPDLSCS